MIASCAPKPIEVQASSQAFCAAMRGDGDMPIGYHGGKPGGVGGDTSDTIARVRRVNARFEAICK